MDRETLDRAFRLVGTAFLDVQDVLGLDDAQICNVFLQFAGVLHHGFDEGRQELHRELRSILAAGRTESKPAMMTAHAKALADDAASRITERSWHR